MCYSIQIAKIYNLNEAKALITFDDFRRSRSILPPVHGPHSHSALPQAAAVEAWSRAAARRPCGLANELY
jgi:hypothetical protein